MAEIHRDIERRHLASAMIHNAHADRVTAWVEGRAPAPRFMAAVAATLDASHVGLSLVLGDRTEAVTVASDPVATAAQEAEFTLGEGPVHDVTAAGGPIMADESAFPLRWPQFAPAVARLGVRAVAAAPLRTPLRANGGCLGVLTVFDPPAEIVGSVEVLSTVADALVDTALLEPESADPLDLPLLAGADHHAVVHQASGIIAAQLGCAPADGLVVLRARAFAAGTPLTTIADEIVHKGLRVT